MMSRRADDGSTQPVEVPPEAGRTPQRASPDLALGPDDNGKDKVSREEIQRLFGRALRVR